MKTKIKFNTLAMIFGVVVLVTLATWFVPGGEYGRVSKDGRTLVVAGSFHYVASQPQDLGELLMAPFKGFVQAANIIAFLFIIGGAFAVVEKTGTLAVAVRQLARTLARKPHLKRFFIPASMAVFSVCGSIFGSSEETLPFILIFIPLAMSLGYDSLVGVAIPFLGTAAGFAGSTLNPFTVGIAQNIAELPLYSGLSYRVVIWLLSTVIMIAFVMWHGRRVQQDPKASPVYELDRQRKHEFQLDLEAPASLGGRHQLVLGAFGFTILLLVVGVLWHHWYIGEIGALFLGFGMVCGIAGRLKMEEWTESFRAGARGMVGVALIIACARAILVVAQDGRIIDTMLYSLSGGIGKLHPVLAAQAMFVAQCVVNFFVHSASGQAMLTMPVMAPLADTVGLSRQIAVLAFQFGEGWINPVLPTSGVTMGVLGLANIAWGQWFRWLLPVQVIFFVLALVLLAIACLIHYQ